MMSPRLDSFVRAFALVGVLGALLDGSPYRTLVASRERSWGFSGRPRASTEKTARSSTHALASAAHARNDRTSLAV